MSIIKWFNKPKWQSPNEQVRITAIKNGEDQELINALPDIIQNDPSPKVQKAALSRIDDPQKLIRILLQHSDKAIKKQASKKLIHAFSQQVDDSQINVFNQLKDPETIKGLAKGAANPEIRKAAIAQIKQQGLLSELLFSEPELDLQKLIIERIDQPSTLTKLAQKAVKKNLAVSDLIAAKLNVQDDEDHDQSAIGLCVALEDVVHGRNQELNLKEVNEQYQAIRPQVSQAIKMRFNGAFEAAKMILDPEHRSQFLQKQKQQRALALLNELEQSIERQRPTELKTIQEMITRFGQLTAEDLPAAEQNRHTQLEQSLTQIRDDIQTAQKIPAKVSQLMDQINQQLNQTVVQPDQLNRFKQHWQQATKGLMPSEALVSLTHQFDDACLKLATKIEQSGKLRDQAATDAIELIEPTIQQIKDGHLIQAKKMTNDLAEKQKLAGHNHPKIKRNRYQLDSVWQQLKDLRNWQKWSNDQARQDIIDEIQDAVGKGLHPDAVMKKLKDANDRWYALEDMEKLPGDKFPSRNQKMWQNFRAVSKSLFDPTQPFFEKRSEQQSDFLTEISDNLKVMNETDLNEAAERDLARMSRQAVKYLKSLDQLPPKERGKTAKNIRKAIDRIDQKLNEFYQIAETKKLRLIDQAQELTQSEDINAAIEMAKQLQQKWKSAGIVKQHTERKLWKKFRKANDAIFKRREQAKKAVNEAHEKQRSEAKSYIADYKQKLQNTTDSEQLKPLKNDFTSGWYALDKPEKLLSHEFNHVLQLIEDAIKQQQHKAVVQSYEVKQQLDQAFASLEQGAIDQAQFDNNTKHLLTDDMVDFFANRINEVDMDLTVSDLLIQGEFMTGLETPEAEMEARMAYQVKILSERMSGAKNSDNHNQAGEWLDQWFLMVKPDAAIIKSNNKRIDKVIKAMMKLLVE